MVGYVRHSLLFNSPKLLFLNWPDAAGLDTTAAQREAVISNLHARVIGLFGPRNWRAARTAQPNLCFAFPVAAASG